MQRGPYGQQARVLADALIEIRHESSEYTSLQWHQKAVKTDPKIKRVYVQNYNYNKLVKSGFVKKFDQPGKRESMFRMLFEADKIDKILGIDRMKSAKVHSIRSVTTPDPNVIDAVTFGEKMFIYMEALRTKANRYDDEIERLKADNSKSMKAMRGLQDEVSKLRKRNQDLEYSLKNKVSAGRHKELLEENRRLKDRLDEQNKQITSLNERRGRTFNLGNVAHIKR